MLSTLANIADIQHLERKGEEGNSRAQELSTESGCVGSSNRSTICSRDKMTWESLWNPPTLHPWVNGHENKDIWWQCMHGCGGTGEGETSEEKQTFILFCCLKPIHRCTLDGQDCLRGWEGRLYCPRSCWGTMEGNMDLENDKTGELQREDVSRMVLGKRMWETARCCWTQLSASRFCSLNNL